MRRRKNVEEKKALLERAKWNRAAVSHPHPAGVTRQVPKRSVPEIRTIFLPGGWQNISSPRPHHLEARRLSPFHS